MTTRTRAIIRGSLKTSFIERNSAISRRSFRSPSWANEGDRDLFHHGIVTLGVPIGCAMRLEAYMPDRPLPSETREAPTPMKTIGNGLMPIAVSTGGANQGRDAATMIVAFGSASKDTLAADLGRE